MITDENGNPDQMPDKKKITFIITEKSLSIFITTTQQGSTDSPILEEKKKRTK